MAVDRASRILDEFAPLSYGGYGGEAKVWGVQISTSSATVYIGPYANETEAVASADRMTKRDIENREIKSLDPPGIVYSALLVDSDLVNGDEFDLLSYD